jgi:hypothetical protein
MAPNPWPDLPVTPANFRNPPREYGILPFWFLNGELNPDEMQYQIRQFRDKGMPGIILHGRYGLEMPYIGEQYLDRIRLAATQGEEVGLQTWIYDEMNWPSGTADGRVLRARPDLAQRYLECINFTVRGPWFTYLTGADSRYLDFERSTPVAAFALGSGGRVIDLTPNLSFVDVIPWEAPPGNWRLVYIVEKRADYYIDALNPESTAQFLRDGYDPYAAAVGDRLSSQVLGFYTDEPAMHYYLTGGDNPIVPWTQDMFGRFQQRNGYNLRPRLPDLFFDVSADSARVRHDFYTTLTEFYSEAFYGQIHAWCRAHDVLFTGHLLYEESLRRLIRVEGNVFRHYEHMDVVGVDHLYPYIGNRDRPDEHVAMKVGSSGAHQLGSPRLLCESFGGIFMDATMQRMKWIADWEYVLGINLLNPHGFHYTLEGPRKRDWPPSQFYQYPWWRYYGRFSEYISRLSHLLSGGRHVAKVAVLWPINSMYATYTPQAHNALGDRTEADFNALTDLLLRAHYDFDYLDEDLFAAAEVAGGKIRLRDESYELLVLPPMAFLKLATVGRIEAFVAQGGRVLGATFLPDRAFGTEGLVDVSGRIRALFGLDPGETQAGFRDLTGIEFVQREHPGGGKVGFLRSYALARQLPMRLQQQLGAPGRPESAHFVIEPAGDASRYFFAPPGMERQEITEEVIAERQAVSAALGDALARLVAPDVTISDPDIFYLHRIKDDRDIYFFINPTFAPRTAEVTIAGEVQPLLWDPSTGAERVAAPAVTAQGRTRFTLALPAVGSAFILTAPIGPCQVLDANIRVDALAADGVSGYGEATEAFVVVRRGDAPPERLAVQAADLPQPLVLDGVAWEFEAEDPNALMIGHWLAAAETPGAGRAAYIGPDSTGPGWLPMVPGAWSYQLPAEPDRPYPIDVWHRIGFRAEYAPPRIDLIVDGFAGSGFELHVNGEPVTRAPVRSSLDSQMKAVDVADLVRVGENTIALRLTVTNSTDGLLDLLKLMGDFSLAPAADGGYIIAAPRRTLQPAPWTAQGYPFYSGCGVYRCSFRLPEAFEACRVVLEPQLADDVLEVIVNGLPAGVRLWEPYEVEITDLLVKGENTLALRVANTPVNVLEAIERPSGLTGAPRLRPYHHYSFGEPK